MRELRPLRLLLTGLMFLSLLGVGKVGASSANLSHSYKTSSSLANGSIVSIDPRKTDYVIAANTNNASRVVGVTVKTDDSLLAVDPASGKVQVATSGSVSTLVSTVNGDIKVGDRIVVSPFNGVGMKAETGSHVIGLAQTALTQGSEGTTTKTVVDRDGSSKQVVVGYVRLSISVGETVAADGVELNSLQKFVKSLTGRTIPTARILVSIAVAIVAIIALITLVYASIYGGIISIGRNPLAKHAVFRALGMVLLMAAMTAGIAGTIIFFLLS